MVAAATLPFDEVNVLGGAEAFSSLDRLRPALHKAILEEAAGRRLPELDEPGWMRMGADVEQITGLDRREVNEQALRYYHTDPTTGYLIDLHNAYTFGRGISVEASDPTIDSWVQRFWNHPRNRASISTAAAQWDLNKNLQLNGELFLIFYTNTMTGQVVVRTVDPLQITHIGYVDGDNKLPQVFVREYRTRDGKKITQTIPDWRYFDTRGGIRELRDVPNTEVAMMHVLSHELSGRGISKLARSIPWAKALKGFMEDRATLTLALATFAFRQKVRGNRQSMRRMAKQWSDYEAQLRYQASGDGRERRQGANTLIENEAASLEQLKTDSGASNAYQDMRMFRQQTGIGHGIFEHYLGDPSTGNLATATAMELPMLKMFEFGQQFWVDVLRDVLSYVILQGSRFNADIDRIVDMEIDQTGRTPIWMIMPTGDTDLSVDVNFPPIVQKDIAIWSTALAQLSQAEQMTGQVIVPAEEKMLTALQMLGYANRASATVAEWRERNFTLPTITPETAGVEEATRKIIGALKRLREQDEDEPPDVGEPLSKSDAEKVEPVRKDDIDQAFDDWGKLPSLEDLAKELGMSVEDLDDA